MISQYEGLELNLAGDIVKIDRRLVHEKAINDGVRFLFFDEVWKRFGLELLEPHLLVTSNPESVQLQFKRELTDGEETKQVRKLLQIFWDPRKKKYYLELIEGTGQQTRTHYIELAEI